jgi:hypothetical protein
MEGLLKELRAARLRAAAKRMNETKAHIEEALELLDDAMAQRAGPKVSVRVVRSYIIEAGYAATQSDSCHVISALDAALRALESKPGGVMPGSMPGLTFFTI